MTLVPFFVNKGTYCMETVGGRVIKARSILVGISFVSIVVQGKSRICFRAGNMSEILGLSVFRTPRQVIFTFGWRRRIFMSSRLV